MAGNTIGAIFRLTTFGESHGPALGGIIDGCPPGIEISEESVQKELDRRKPGGSRFVTQRRESDTIRILSGIFQGISTGTPIGFIIENHDQRSKDYSDIQNIYRPGHADYTYQQKYGIRDYRGGGRASARETAIRVAGGAIAKIILHHLYQVHIRAHVSQIGEKTLHFKDWNEVENNPFFCPNTEQIAELTDYLDSIRKKGDSVGAAIRLVVKGAPPGWGEPVFDRLDADLAKALMSINAVKGVSFGDGFDVVRQYGSQHRDELDIHGFLSNHAGGILGGISSGQEIIAHIAFKPTSSILIPGRSISKDGEAKEIITKGRHDPCVALRAVPIVEAMAALVLLDHAMRHHAQCKHAESD